MQLFHQPFRFDGINLIIYPMNITPWASSFSCLGSFPPLLHSVILCTMVCLCGNCLALLLPRAGACAKEMHVLSRYSFRLIGLRCAQDHEPEVVKSCETQSQGRILSRVESLECRSKLARPSIRIVFRYFDTYRSSLFER